jgi:hypothetical protein
LIGQDILLRPAQLLRQIIDLGVRTEHIAGAGEDEHLQRRFLSCAKLGQQDQENKEREDVFHNSLRSSRSCSLDRDCLVRQRLNLGIDSLQVLIEKGLC